MFVEIVKTLKWSLTSKIVSQIEKKTLLIKESPPFHQLEQQKKKLSTVKTT